MKRHPFYLFVIAVLCFIASVIIYGKSAEVPNDAVGQEKQKIFDVIVPVPDNTIRVIIGDKEYITDQNMYMFLGLMAVYGELKLYSAACYADSQKTAEGFMWITTDSLGNWIDSGNDVYWSHREPTLQGFMQFLEEKYND